MVIEFFVDGTPRAKQSFRFSKRGSYQRSVTIEWVATVSAYATIAMAQLEKIVGPVSVKMVFYFKGRRRVIDNDNLSKAVLDGLKGVCFEDDKWVDRLYIEKHFEQAQAGVSVTVSPITEGGVC